MKRVPLTVLSLLVILISVAVAQAGPADRSSTSQKLRDAEIQMQSQLSALHDFVAVYTVVDDIAARIEGRLPYFNPARVDPGNPVASAVYLESLPNPVESTITWIRAIYDTERAPKITILNGSLTLQTPGEYVHTYPDLRKFLPGTLQKIRELNVRIRTLQTLLDQPGWPAEPPPAVSSSLPGSTSTGKSPEQLVEEGIILYYNAVFDEAYELFDQAVRQEPTLVAAYYGRGCVAAVNADYESALGDFATALSHDGSSLDAANVLHSRGVVFLALGREKEAIRNLQEASRRGHLLSAQVLRRMALHWEEDGFTHYKSNRYAEAGESFFHAIIIDPSYPDPYFNNGLMLEKLNLFPAAIGYYNDYLEVLGEYGTGPEKVVCSPLYSVSEDEKLPDLALDTDGFSASGEAHFRIGLNFYHLKDLGQAITHYTQAIKYESVGTPGNLGRDYYHRARAYYERGGKGDKKKALDDLRRACRRGDAASCEMKNKLADELDEPR